MFSFHSATNARRHAQGFTLVEVMVGMIIAMLGIIIMMQMFALFEGQKRTTTGGDDAQNTGAIAMYGIQQNIKQAGYCFAGPASAAAITLPLAPGIGNLSPVMIDVAAINGIKDINTNTLMVTYGNDACPPESASGVVASGVAAIVNVLAYAVIGGNLMQCDYVARNCAIATNWDLIADDIVSMKVECNANQAVRIALVTRNQQLNKGNVTAASAAAAISTPPTWSGASPIDLTGTSGTADAGFGWQNYRYKTFETLVPIRNTIWTGNSGC